MLESRVVDVSKAGVRQSATEAHAMCSQFGTVRSVRPWRAPDGQHHAFVEFQYKVGSNFRDKLADRTGFAVVRVGDSDTLAESFHAFKNLEQRQPPSGWPLGDCTKRSMKTGKGKAPRRSMTPAAVAALHVPMAEKATIASTAPSVLDYGTPSASKPSHELDATRPLSSPLALLSSLVRREPQSNSADAPHCDPPKPDFRPPFLDIRNVAPISTPSICCLSTVDGVPSGPCKPHAPSSPPPPPPPSSSIAPAPAAPASRQPLLDIRNVIPSTEQSLTPKEPRHVLADLLVKNVTVQSFLTIATWYRDRNMLKQAAEIAKAALKEKRRRGELRRCDAMALNLFLSTVSTAYARACQPKESQRYMLEASRYINLAWADEPDGDHGNTPVAYPQNGQREGAAAPAKNCVAPESAAAWSGPNATQGKWKDAAADDNMGALPVRQPQSVDVSAPVDVVALVSQREDSRASPAPSHSESGSERTVAVPMEEVHVRKMTLAEMLDMAGTLLKHAARLSARTDH